MASSSAQERSGVITPVPHFIVDFEKVEMKPKNFLKGKEYYLEARNFFVSGLAKTAQMMNVPAVKSLLFNLWATALLVAGENPKGAKYEYVTGFLPSETDESQLEEFSFRLRDFRDVLHFPAKPADTKTYESLPSDAQLVDFLDEIGYEWDDKLGKVTHTIKRFRMTLEWSYIFAHFNQCLTCKVGSHDQASTVHLQILYSAVKNRQIDWAKLIYDDLLNKLSLPQSSKAPQRHTTVMYPVFSLGSSS